MHTMTPWAERWEASIESDLLLDGDELEVEFDFANLMRGDAASRSAYYQSGIQNGWLTRNEARIAENLNPIEGLNEPLRPLNMVQEGAAEEQDEALEQSLEEDEEESGQDQDPDEVAPVARFRALVACAADRWARRLSRAGVIEDKDIALVAQALAVPESEAQLWAQEQQDLEESSLRLSLIKLGMNP
jgi:hypothetical protein